MSDATDPATQTPQDARNQARALIDAGDALSAKGQQKQALECWENAARADRTWALPWRRLGMAYFNTPGEKNAAKGALQRAFRLEPSADILGESDALLRAIQSLPRERLDEFEKHADLVRGNDALRLAAAEALNLVGRFDHAQALLLERPFAAPDAPAAAEQYRRAQITLLRQALWRNDNTRPAWQALLSPLPAFGNASPSAAEQAELHYWLATACQKQNLLADAQHHWTAATEAPRGQPVADFYAGLALRQLAQTNAADHIFAAMEETARNLLASAPSAPTEETTLPAPIRQPRQRRQEIHACFIEALARFGLRQTAPARRLLGDVLRDDPNHAPATDFMRWLDWQM